MFDGVLVPVLVYGFGCFCLGISAAAVFRWLVLP